MFESTGARGAYLISKLYGAALVGGRCLFQSQMNYSHEILKLSNFLFPNNQKVTTIKTYNVTYPRSVSYFQFFISNILVPYMHFNLFTVRYLISAAF